VLVEVTLSLSLAVSFLDARQKRPRSQRCSVFDGEAVNESLLYRTNEVFINWLFFALMLTATEIGFRWDASLKLAMIDLLQRR
jgi:hypothetical protein